MNRRNFIKSLAGLVFIPLIGFAETYQKAPNQLSGDNASKFIESNSWIVKPEDISPLNNAVTPDVTFFSSIKNKYYNLKNRYKAAIKSFNDPQSRPFDK